MSGPTATDSHILLVPLPAFGHIRPVCILAARLLLEKENVVLTLFSPPHEFEQVRKDITTQFAKSLIPPDVKDKALERIRIVTTYKSTDIDGFDLFTPFFQSYPAAYETLYHSRPFTCATTGEVFGAIPPPVAVILDFCSFPQCQATRALSGTSVPIIILLAAPSSAIIRGFGPESLGGIGDFGKRVDDEAARLGVSRDEVADKLFNRTEGKILKIAGLPAMYDYERFPQKLPFDPKVGPIILGGIQFFNDCDAALISSSRFYEDTSLTQLKSWFKSLPQNPPIYAIGPLLPPGYGHHSMERSGLEKNQVEKDLDIFLREMQSKYGEKSVIFISFGTNCWPTVPDYIDEVIQALIEREIPFILCHASPFAKVPEEIDTNIKASRLGFLAPWVPQQYILDHPATGWFLTHCGNGSVTESLGSGIPMICWPFYGDQPSTAAHLSCNLKVAIELFEVRTGLDGLKPVLRNGFTAKGTREAVGKEFREVLDVCHGEQGEKLRRNAEEMKCKYRKAWDDDGEAKRGLNTFLERHV